MTQPNDDMKALLDFVMDSDILDKIEAEISNFNVFETLGVTRTEIRHSNMLAWLMNPNENHGLDDLFARNLIKHILYNNLSDLSDMSSIMNVATMNFNQAQVLREWRNIDILFTCDINKFVVVFENKVDSKEHGKQLDDYFSKVNHAFPDYTKLFVYLTPLGDTPSDEENWVICSYSTVVTILENILSLRKSSLNSNVYHFIYQYQTILRRYIVGSSDLEQICQEIYLKHQKALDLIFQYKPDIYMDLANLFKELIVSHNLILDDSSKSCIRFTTDTLDKMVPNMGHGWTKSGRILLFEIENKDCKAAVKLIIGPAEQEIREKLYECSKVGGKAMRKCNKFSQKWHTIYRKELMTKKDFDTKDFDELKALLEQNFAHFVQQDMITLVDLFKNLY